MTREELLKLLWRLGIRGKYFCDEGAHKGHMYIILGRPYMTPDEIAALQKEIHEVEKTGAFDA